MKNRVGDNSLGVADHIRRLLRAPDFGVQPAANALRKLKRFYTTEKQVMAIPMPDDPLAEGMI
jgi:hypothetical protein